MANQNYAQVATLLDEGKFRWETDSVVAILYTSAVFDESDKTVADLTGARLTTQLIQGRWLGPEGQAMGLPVAFPKADAGPTYQIVVAQEVGNGNPNLLAFIDSNADDSPITVLRSGTLIVRPVLAPVEVPPERPPTIGVWMKLPNIPVEPLVPPVPPPVLRL